MIANAVLRTPLMPFDMDGSIFLKPENLQPFGSYKIRGVTAAIRAAQSKNLKVLSAASAGNMAQAVAFAAQRLKMECRIYVPDSAPDIKKQAIKKLGADLIELPFEEIWDLVRNPPEEPTGLFVHPVFTPGLLDGYGEIAFELLVDRPTLGAVVIPFGVGGLTLGMARALKSLKPEIQIYACEPETAAPLKASLLNGRPMKVDRRPSFVDAIGTPEVLPRVFEEIVPLVEDSLVVSLDEISRAIGLLAHKKLICEGAAAAGLAASLKLAQENPKLEIACILTGGNLPQAILIDILGRLVQ